MFFLADRIAIRLPTDCGEKSDTAENHLRSYRRNGSTIAGWHGG